MTEHDCPASLQEQLRRLRRSNRLLTLGVLLALAAGLPGLHAASSSAAARVDPDGILEVRGLVVRDADGTPRVILGAPLPDPMIGGKQQPRVAPLSGLLILDHTGTERGGYGTAHVGDYSEALLTLDDARGREVFTVVANADAGATLSVRNQKGASAVLTTYRQGPELHLSGPGGTALSRIPADAPDLD